MNNASNSLFFKALSLSCMSHPIDGGQNACLAMQISFFIIDAALGSVLTLSNTWNSSVKNWYPFGLSSTEQSGGISILRMWFDLMVSNIRLFNTPHATRTFEHPPPFSPVPWTEEALSEGQVIAVSKLSEYRPRCLQSTSLDEERVQKQESCLCQSNLIDTIWFMLPHYFLDSL